MNKSQIELTLLIVVMVGTGMFAFATTKMATDNWWKDELTRRGYATYYLDGNNDRQWNWKETK